MSTPYKVAVLVGSLRQASINRKLALALAELAPPSLQLELVEIGGAVVLSRCHGARVSSQSASWPRVSSGMSSWRGMAMPCLML